jgi:hypothetical protein
MDKGASNELVENGVEPGGYNLTFLPFVACFQRCFDY